MATPQKKRTPWSVFASWHRDETFWQGVWANALSALIVALVIYLVAALSGVVSRKPLAWLLLLAGLSMPVIAVGQARAGGDRREAVLGVALGVAVVVVAVFALVGIPLRG